MDNFNLKKFLIENTLTINSRLLREANEQTITDSLAQLYKQYYALLAKMYGPGGTEDRKAIALVKHQGNQGSFDSNRKATSPEIDKAASENSVLMKQMGEVGSKIQQLYQQLEDMGKGDLVKKMRDYRKSETKKYTLALADQAEREAQKGLQTSTDK